MTGALWEWLELDVAEGDALVAVGLEADKAGGLVLGGWGHTAEGVVVDEAGGTNHLLSDPPQPDLIGVALDLDLVVVPAVRVAPGKRLQRWPWGVVLALSIELVGAGDWVGGWDLVDGASAVLTESAWFRADAVEVDSVIALGGVVDLDLEPGVDCGPCPVVVGRPQVGIRSCLDRRGQRQAWVADADEHPGVGGGVKDAELELEPEVAEGLGVEQQPEVAGADRDDLPVDVAEAGGGLVVGAVTRSHKRPSVERCQRPVEQDLPSCATSGKRGRGDQQVGGRLGDQAAAEEIAGATGEPDAGEHWVGGAKRGIQGGAGVEAVGGVVDAAEAVADRGCNVVAHSQRARFMMGGAKPVAPSDVGVQLCQLGGGGAGRDGDCTTVVGEDLKRLAAGEHQGDLVGELVH